MKMFEQPHLADYMAYIQNYEQFITILIALGIPLILAILRFFPRGKGMGLGFNLLTILASGLIVRIPLMNQPYWYDEAFTSAMSQVKLGNFFTALQGDVHPPGYYLIVRMFVMIFGHNDFTMRLPALLSSLGLIVTMYEIAKAYGGERTAKWAALITALLPVAVYYATEARYPMFLALILSIAYMGIQKKKASMIAMPLSIAAMTHVNGWFYVLVMGAVWFLQTKKLKGLILPASTMGAWFPIALIQAQDVSDGFWLPPYQPYRHLVQMSIGGRFETVNTALFPMLMTIVVLGVSLWLWRKKADSLWFAVVVIVPLLQWVVSLLWHPIYLPRTLFLSTLLLIIPVAWYLETHVYRIIAFGGLLAMIMGIGSLYLMDRAQDSNHAIQACAGYAIYASNVHTAILARHYSDATVIVYEQGNSVAQQLPPATQAVLFDGISNIFRMDAMPLCVVSQVSVFNSPEEMAHLQRIAQIFDPEIEFIGSNSKYGYYLVMKIN